MFVILVENSIEEGLFLQVINNNVFVEFEEARIHPFPSVNDILELTLQMNDFPLLFANIIIPIHSPL